MIIVMAIIAYILYLAVNIILKNRIMHIWDVVIICALSGYALLMIKEKISQEKEKLMIHRSAYDEGWG